MGFSLYALSFCFFRNGVPVRPDGRNILRSTDGSLILYNVKPSDEGTYTCNAYTGIYSVSATAEVRVTKDTQQGENNNLTHPKMYLIKPHRSSCFHIKQKYVFSSHIWLYVLVLAYWFIRKYRYCCIVSLHYSSKMSETRIARPLIFYVMRVRVRKKTGTVIKVKIISRLSCFTEHQAQFWILMWFYETKEINVVGSKPDTVSQFCCCRC